MNRSLRIALALVAVIALLAVCVVADGEADAWSIETREERA
jgi:hypothetical protein